MTGLLEISLSNAAMALALALVAAGVGAACRRPALAHSLWLLVLLKLVAPPLLGVPIPWSRPAGAKTVATDSPGPIASGRVVVHQIPSPVSPAPNAMAARSSPPPPRPSAVAAMPAPRRGGGPVPWESVLLATWAAGSLAWFAAAGVRIARFRRLLRLAEPAPEWLRERARDLADRLGVARCPEVWVLPVAVSPLLWAMGGPPRLVLPGELLRRLGPDERDALLAHELAHLRRRDHLVRWLELVAVGLYWWHPAAWWARREIGRAEERCCDAMVVWSSPGAALAYAKALLKTVDFLTEARPALPPAASGAGHISTLRRRVAMILNAPTRPRLSWPARLGAVALGLLVLPVAPQRLGAKLVDEPASNSDDQPSRRSVELERRLKELEAKIDRLSSRLPSGDAGRPKADRPASRAKAEAKEKAEKPESQEERERRIEEAVRKAIDPERMEAMAKRIEEAVTKSIDPERMERLGREIEEAVKKGIDPKRMEEMGRQIEEAVTKAIDPKRMEEMGKQIEEAVKKGIDPKKMEEMAKQIEEAVTKSIDPKKMEAMGKQIEEAVKKGIDTKQFEQLGRDLDELRKKDRPAEEPATGPSRRERRLGEAPEPRRDSGREERDLERRLRRLEEKLDRILRDAPDKDEPSAKF
jgi:beta-lactamase regulating signal transducer with metallopeptidase domain